MIDLLKKGILTGIGIGLMTKDKIEDLAKQTAKEAKLTEEDARKFAEDLLKQSEEAKHKIEEKIDERIHTYLNNFGVATKKDIEQLQQQIQSLHKDDMPGKP